MNTTEATLLCRYAKAACPQQAFDQYTPDAWADLLAGIRFVDAKEAITNITRRQPFVAPSEIITEVRKIRERRINEHPPVDPPPDLDPIETNQWLKETRARIADGEIIPTPALTVRPVRQAIEAAVPKVNREAS